MLCSDPSNLIGRHFQHKIQESADDFAAWYKGTVKGIDTSNVQNPTKTVYDLTYDQGGDDEIFTFPLLLAHVKKRRSHFRLNQLIIDLLDLLKSGLSKNNIQFYSKVSSCGRVFMTVAHI